ncbi:MAG: aminotransferase class V-fold PLP-dependent enzyme [Jatrophihabitans sp.]|nr:MAG: aminotransferase class V-fold PLP-dependent enzyme [Jatrophihabitans sp.]
MGAFLDAAAGTPLHPAAREALLAALAEGWGDPGRLYGAGRRAALLLDAAREVIAGGIGARPDEVSFCANGTQALHAAVLGAIAGGRPSREVVHSAVEHSAVLHAIEHGARAGHPIAVDRLGRVDAAAFVAAANAPQVTVAALQAANHEVGTAQPAASVAARIPVPLVVDATQTVGHADLPDGWSVLAADARSWGGPALGVVAVRTGTRWRSPFPADDREGGRIPGLPDVPAAVAAAAGLRAVLAERREVAARHRAMVAHIRERVAATVPDCEVLGDPDERLPHIVTFSCLYVDGEALLLDLDRRGFAVSSGSSCTSSTLEPSHVLVAMGALTSGNVRISLSRDTSEAEVDEFLTVLPGAVAGVREQLRP